MKLAQVHIGNEYRVNDTEGLSSFGPLGTLVSSLLSNVYVLTGLIFFAFIIYGGMHIIFSGDRDRVENLAKSQKVITAALVGFLIIFASYWIIQIISYVTGFDILNPGL